MTIDTPYPHPPDEVLRHYASGALAAGPRHRIEPHLDRCAHCRTRLADFTDTRSLERIWQRLDHAIDLPSPARWERLLLAIRVPDHVARLLVATPALRASWLCGTAVTLLFAVLSARLVQPGGAPLTFLAIAPLLPAAGVAGSLARRFDPAYELGQVAAPSAFRLVLLRACAVLAVTTVLTASVSFALPHLSYVAFGWLLPSALLTVLSLLLLPRIGAVPAAGATGAAWVGAVAFTHHSVVLFSPAGQGALAVLLLTALLMLVRLRADFDFEKGTRL
ncbi:hypothetical protein PV682_28315 [Streptomyces niveiscabiei]|uniref:hypothetical protein n=1 Tax=Streptomyces niveiscabiei TaxID=164115 RepID=UPI0029BB2610|nr:hypothetical protein [Streptomyces niveiscabiei]MDX3385348.1 hypothetical protein [Streptomyces niveiscabiei]